MVRHGTLGTQAYPVVPNGCDDKLLGDIVIVPGARTTFVFGELLCLDNGCLWTVFFDGFPPSLGTDMIAPRCIEVFCSDDSITNSPVCGVCHHTFRAHMFNVSVLLFDDLSFQRTVVHGWSCVKFTI